jgi:hypothetical protein
VFRRAVIAAVIGGSCGAMAGYWSTLAETPAEAPAVATVPMAAPAVGVDRLSSERLPQTSTQPATRSLDSSDAVQRARELAKRVDVIGLITLREEVLDRADQAGERDAPATKRQLDELDRYLAEARVQRLALDAAEFRKRASNGNPRE